MKFELHPDAVAAFTAKATELVDAVRTRASSPEADHVGYKPDVHVGFHLTEQDLRGPMEVFESDRYGRRVSRFIAQDGTFIGLDENSYPKLGKLAESIHKTAAFRNAISIRFV